MLYFLPSPKIASPQKRKDFFLSKSRRRGQASRSRGYRGMGGAWEGAWNPHILADQSMGAGHAHHITTTTCPSPFEFLESPTALRVRRRFCRQISGGWTDHAHHIATWPPSPPAEFLESPTALHGRRFCRHGRPWCVCCHFALPICHNFFLLWAGLLFLPLLRFKVQIFWEEHKNLKKNLTLFDVIK